jgi:hypothetical protein
MTTGWTTEVPFPAGTGTFSLRHRVDIGSGAHPAFYPVGYRCPSPRIKPLGREADYSLPSNAEVKNAWSYTSTPTRLPGVVLN